MGTVIKMYGTITGGSQDALAVIDSPMVGDLVGVDWAVRGVLATDFILSAQLSFRATYGAINDDRAIISEVQNVFEITTTGASQVNMNKYVRLPDIPIMGGERIYLNVSSTASVIGVVIALLHFSFDLDKVSTRRR
jgi:hypothetical protein